MPAIVRHTVNFVVIVVGVVGHSVVGEVVMGTDVMVGIEIGRVVQGMGHDLIGVGSITVRMTQVIPLHLRHPLHSRLKLMIVMHLRYVCMYV